MRIVMNLHIFSGILTILFLFLIFIPNVHAQDSVTVQNKTAINELPPAEQSKPYAKYYYEKLSPPDGETLKAIQTGPMDPSKAVPINELNQLLNPGYAEVETGYCMLPDGTGYVAVLTKMPGVTIDMLNWWFAWHSLEDLRYKIWYPSAHYAISVSEEDRQHILDPKLSLEERRYEVTHHVVEDIGLGSMPIDISFLRPENMGFDMDRFKVSNVATAIGASAGMVHLVREIPGGIEMRSRFWLGYKFVDKQPVRTIPEGKIIPVDIMKGLALHCITEYANLRAILPKIYKEQGGVVQ